MKSRITIDVDYDNQPILKIEYSESDDVRDKLVKRFLEGFGGLSSWCKYTPMNSGHNTTLESWLHPIKPNSFDLEENSKLLKIRADEAAEIEKELNTLHKIKNE